MGVKGYEVEGCCSGFEGRDPRLMELSAHSGTYTCISQYRAGIRKSQRQEKISQADFTDIRPVYQAADSPLSLDFGHQVLPASLCFFSSSFSRHRGITPSPGTQTHL